MLGSGDERGCADENNTDRDGSAKLVLSTDITDGDDDDVTSILVGKDSVVEETSVVALGWEEVKEKVRAKDD